MLLIERPRKPCYPRSCPEVAEKSKRCWRSWDSSKIPPSSADVGRRRAKSCHNQPKSDDAGQVVADVGPKRAKIWPDSVKSGRIRAAWFRPRLGQFWPKLAKFWSSWANDGEHVDGFGRFWSSRAYFGQFWSMRPNSTRPKAVEICKIMARLGGTSAKFWPHRPKWLESAETGHDLAQNGQTSKPSRQDWAEFGPKPGPGATIGRPLGQLLDNVRNCCTSSECAKFVRPPVGWCKSLGETWDNDWVLMTMDRGIGSSLATCAHMRTHARTHVFFQL